MKHRYIFVAWSLLASIVPPLAQGSQSSSPVQEPKMYADVIDIAPWGRMSADGRPAGVYADIFKRLAERSNCPLELRLTPIPRAVAEVSGDVAQATIMLDRVDLNVNAVPIGEVTGLRIEMWLPAGSKLQNLQDFEGRTVGVLRGPTYHEGFDRNTKIHKYSITSPKQQLEMVRRKRLDGAIGVRENFLVAAKESKVSTDDFAAPLALGQRSVKLWVAPGLRDSDCAARLAHSLIEMRRSGEIDRLIAEGIKSAN